VSVARPHQDECRAVAWAPGGRWLLSGSFDGSVCFLSASGAALEPVASFQQHRDKVLQALWHPTIPAIVTSGADKRVKLWRLG
jgi:WD40 repeat protein